MQITGPFSVSTVQDPPYDELEGIALGRATVTKVFDGPLQAKSTVQMLGARTAVPTSAAYVAVERIVGTLAGLEGSFVVTHVGFMSAAKGFSLDITIVPDSGTGALKGISGTMAIVNKDGAHTYTLDYTLGETVPG